MINVMANFKILTGYFEGFQLNFFFAWRVREDWHLRHGSAQLLFQFFADRYEQAGLLITSNLPFSEWGHRSFKASA